MIAIQDNKDSFTHNLEQFIGEFTEVEVNRYREPPLYADAVVFSPGPGSPSDFPVMYEILEEFQGAVLGVCLGHQAIVDFYGGEVVKAPEVVHGKQSMVSHNGGDLFRGLPDPLTVGRYHSLVVEDVIEPLVVVARGAGEVMAVRHRSKPVFGVQFHPESFLTPRGRDIIENFVDIALAQREVGGVDA